FVAGGGQARCGPGGDGRRGRGHVATSPPGPPGGWMTPRIGGGGFLAPRVPAAKSAPRGAPRRQCGSAPFHPGRLPGKYAAVLRETCAIAPSPIPVRAVHGLHASTCFSRSLEVSNEFPRVPG